MFYLVMCVRVCFQKVVNKVWLQCRKGPRVHVLCQTCLRLIGDFEVPKWGDIAYGTRLLFVYLAVLP